MKGTKSASRYAKALLDLAIEKNIADEVNANMQNVLAASKESRDFQLFLDSPVINPEKKTEIFKTIFGGFNELSAAFSALVIKNGRESLLPAIATSYEEQLKAHQGIVPVTLVSASQLDESTKTTILSKIQSSVKGKIELKEQIDPSIIGGFVVKMGDQRIDASILNQLNNLKQRLTR